ncbi:hypothetical protein LCGC14_2501760, partial [marine sediment metagenome]
MWLFVIGYSLLVIWVWLDVSLL